LIGVISCPGIQEHLNGAAEVIEDLATALALLGRRWKRRVSLGKGLVIGQRGWPFARGGSGADVSGYRLLGEIGSGGFSTVYLAEDLTAGRRVALKVARSRDGSAGPAAAGCRRSWW
jgi:hypothetical protein